MFPEFLLADLDPRACTDCLTVYRSLLLLNVVDFFPSEFGSGSEPNLCLIKCRLCIPEM